MNHLKLQNEQRVSHRMGGICRRYRRGRVAGFSGDITNGSHVIGGVVDNVSAAGFKMSQVDDAFSADEHTYYTVVYGKGKRYKLLAKPCWSRRSESGMEIGFKIIDASWEWTEFILENVPEMDFSSTLFGNVTSSPN